MPFDFLKKYVIIILDYEESGVRPLNGNKFDVGQHVVYGVHGVCLIEDIRETTLSSMMLPQDYYFLKQIKRGSTIYVPCSNDSGKYKLRTLLTSDEINDLICSVRGKHMQWNMNRKERTVRFREILSQGISSDLLLMIFCIREQRNEFYDAKKKLSGSDSDILQSAENLVNQEFSFVLGIDEEDVPDYIEKLLNGTSGSEFISEAIDA